MGQTSSSTRHRRDGSSGGGPEGASRHHGEGSSHGDRTFLSVPSPYGGGGYEAPGHAAGEMGGAPDSMHKRASSQSSLTSLPPNVAVPPNAEMIGPYAVEQVLGKGSFAEVKLGRHVVTQDRVALKIIDKGNLSKGKRKVHLQREIQFLKLLSHPHIAALYEVIEDASHYVLIMEHASGGELLQYIRNADKHRLTERESRRLFRQILSALDYCHQNSLIHRDIKPENILLDANGEIKIIDFGFSREFSPDSVLESFIGSPHYAAPELLRGIKYSGPEVDIWSLGILLFVMVCGRQPFKHPDMKVLYDKITACQYEFPDFISASARDLITRILRVVPTERLTMQQIKVHPWVNEGYDAIPHPFVAERMPILSADNDILDQLTAYGFDKEEARATLLTNEPGIVRSFYHLLTDRRERLEAYQAHVDSMLGVGRATPSPLGASPLSRTVSLETDGQNLVMEVDTGRYVPISALDKKVRRQIRQQETFQRFASPGPTAMAVPAPVDDGAMHA